MMPFGLRVKQSEIREKIGLSDPGDDDDLLIQPGQTAAPANSADKKPDAKEAAGDDERKSKTAALSAIVSDHKRACRCGACVALLAADAGEPDALDQVDALFAEAVDDWEAMAAPIVQPIADIIENASSFEEALNMLQAAGPDASTMAERLARLTAIGRGIGDIAD